MKWGPTWANTLPLRIVYVTTPPEGKGRLLPHLQPGNVGKATAAAASSGRHETARSARASGGSARTLLREQLS
jgi:hypothetical protein